MFEKIKSNNLAKVVSGILLIWILGGIAISYIEDGDFDNIGNSLWWAIVTMTTVGYGDMSPESSIGRVLAIVIMFCGISLIAIVTGTISSIFTANKIMEGKGLGNINFNKHTLICGWSNNISEIINSIITDNKNCNVVLINNENEDTVNSLLSAFQDSNIKYVKGDFSLDSILSKANAQKAESAIILNNQDLKNDEKVILSTLTLKKISNNIRVIAQISDKEKISFLKRANVDAVLVNDNFESFMATFHITNPSIAQTIEQIIDFKTNNNIENRDIPSNMVGSTFAELFDYFYKEKNEICLGLYSDEENMGISELLSSDASALDKFIESKLKEAGHSLEEKNKLNINLNPNKDDVISKGQGAIILK
tara:strand:- start:1633 stop:2730 length:1098 start_codon:yes stop_codon:yes gene_type:complete